MGICECYPLGGVRTPIGVSSYSDSCTGLAVKPTGASRFRKRGSLLDQQHQHPGQPPNARPTDDHLVKQQTADLPVVSASDGRRPAPFVPDFSWRPGYSDYPVALIDSPISMRRRAALAESGWGDAATLDDAIPHRSPARYIPHALAVAAVVAAVMSNGYWLDRSGAPEDEVTQTPAALVNDSQGGDDEDTGNSLLDRTQQPGQGGDLGDPTATSEMDDDDGGVEGSDVSESTPTAGGSSQAAATSTQRPLIPDPSSPAVTSTVQMPEAGVESNVASEGETLLDFASYYDLSVPTLLWANGLSDPAAELEDGAEVLIPPVNGVLHTVETSDTVQSIADRYGVEPADITGFEPNGIGGSPSLRVGQLVMVPGGVISDWGKVQEYEVREGDNLWIIADYYGLDPQTLAWANTLPRPELISIGQVLDIPPGDGALITVEAGDNVEAIAERFGVDPGTIRDYEFNNLQNGRVLQQGQKLLVPGAPLPVLEIEEPTELDADTVAGEGAFNPATGGFIWPTDGFISQEFHGNHNGLDVANEEWTPVNAADGGIVIFAGWNDYGLGYAVGIDHGNGYQTWYGHMLNQPYVEVGQVVWQGGYLGPMGSTGKSTGPHLHFIVMKDGVYQNPMDYLQP